LTGFANVLAQAVAAAYKNKAMLVLLDQQKLLAEELQHRVRNNLQLVNGMLEAYARTTSDDTARQGIGSISRRVLTLAQIYDSLLGVGLSHTMDLGLYLEKLCINLPGLQHDASHVIDLVCCAESIVLPLNGVTALGTAVAELVANSYGHAFIDKGGTITVTLTRSADVHEAILTIQDDGVGFTAKAETSRRGMDLVRRLTEQIGGTLNVQSEKGTVCTLAFPVPAPSGRFRSAA
jgi:two-component sensor histidine kinase